MCKLKHVLWIGFPGFNWSSRIILEVDRNQSSSNERHLMVRGHVDTRSHLDFDPAMVWHVCCYKNHDRIHHFSLEKSVDFKNYNLGSEKSSPELLGAKIIKNGAIPKMYRNTSFFNRKICRFQKS